MNQRIKKIFFYFLFQIIKGFHWYIAWVSYKDIFCLKSKSEETKIKIDVLKHNLIQILINVIKQKIN